jgi:two-component system OmpR family sensor kinase
VTGDEIRLREVLDNLLANARAHTPADTPVSVDLRHVAGSVAVSVTDHGSGLTEEQAARVFERFYRADDSRTRASGGAGLGLSIVAAVAEAHGGTAEARPTPGGGATFVVTLPPGAG